MKTSLRNLSLYAMARPTALAASSSKFIRLTGLRLFERTVEFTSPFFVN